jgi:hypothetical protein
MFPSTLFGYEIGDNGPRLLIGFIIIAVSLWLSFRLYKKTNWPFRIKGFLIPLMLFCPVVIFTLFFGTHSWNSPDNMGVGFLFIYLIILSIICYLIGLIIDLTKNRLKNNDNYVRASSWIRKSWISNLSWKSIIVIIILCICLEFYFSFRESEQRLKDFKLKVASECDYSMYTQGYIDNFPMLKTRCGDRFIPPGGLKNK